MNRSKSSNSRSVNDIIIHVHVSLNFFSLASAVSCDDQGGGGASLGSETSEVVGRRIMGEVRVAKFEVLDVTAKYQFSLTYSPKIRQLVPSYAAPISFGPRDRES